MNKKDRFLGIIVLILNVIYLGWLISNIHGQLGWIFWTAEFMIFSLTLLFVINHWTQNHKQHATLPPSGSLDIFITIVDEPLELFIKTIRAAINIDYDNKRIYILDDGNRPEVKELTTRFGATYIERQGRQDYKAGNLNTGLAQSQGDYILVLDADQVVQPNIAKDLLGHFVADNKLAMITTRQKFAVPDNDFNHDILFYEHMQTGKNANNAAISCGSGVFYRRTALEAIGGFQIWNIVEDLYTSYVLHINKFKTLYINKPYTLGTAPVDLSTIYQQRGTWATDTLRIFFRRSPLFTRGLTIRQRLHYFELAWAYIVSALAILVLFLLPPLTLIFDIHFMNETATYLLLRLPSLLAILYFYYRLSGRKIAICQFWAGLFPVYFKAIIVAITPLRFKYQVTNKLAGIGKRDIALVIPHILLLLLGIGALVWRIGFVDHALTSFSVINLMWVCLMIFWFIPIIRKGFLLE